MRGVDHLSIEGGGGEALGFSSGKRLHDPPRLSYLLCGRAEDLVNRLYLVGLSGKLEDGSEATLATIFPDFPTRVFAHWYSGILRIPEGKRIEYVHMGYGSKYERDLLLNIDQGVVTDASVRNNGTAEEPNAPEGYSIAAMTVFGRKPKDEGQ